MKQPYLSVKDFGPIQDAGVQFGDLTFLVGPQASGKSLLLQSLKLAIDGGPVSTSLKRYGFDWGGDSTEFLTAFFGEGIGSSWKPDFTQVHWNGRMVDPRKIIGPGKRRDESLFYVPAQRVLALSTDWPRDFMSYGITDPFVLRSYSENIRMLMEAGLGRGGAAVFPQPGRLKQIERELISERILAGGKLVITRTAGKRRIMLQFGNRLSPPVVWSAGQREFVPLLLGLYYLLPSAKIGKRKTTEWVVIEEPEMGLHPAAISAIMLLVFELMARGYRVVISTHSDFVVNLGWAIKTLQDNGAGGKQIVTGLGYSWKASLAPIAEMIATAEIKSFYFDPREDGTHTVDISALDPGSNDERVAGWGGLTHYADVVIQNVADVVAQTGDLP